MKRKAAKSLFKKPAPVAKPATDENLRLFFRSIPTPLEQLKENISVMESAAAAAEDDENIERAPEHVSDVRIGILILRDAVEAGDAARAAVAAMRLTESWMMLRADAIFAGAVREKEARLAKQRPTVTDMQIAEALKKHSTKKDAAAALGISERQIRNRRPKRKR